MNVKNENIFINFDETLNELRKIDNVVSNIYDIIYSHKSTFTDVFVIQQILDKLDEINTFTLIQKKQLIEKDKKLEEKFKKDFNNF